MNENIEISVLIVTYNNSGTIAECLDSLKEQNYKSFEILLRDNASDDNTVDIVNSYDEVKLFATDENIGFGAAMNFLAVKASGKYLYILNPDCVCPQSMLQQLYDFARKHTGAISPALYYPDGRRQDSARELPTYESIIFSRRSPLYLLGFTTTSSAGYIAPEQPTKVPAVSATALFIPRTTFECLDGFDDRFFMYGEDLDLCKRLGDDGYDIWYLPDIKLKHVLGASAHKAELKTAYHHHLSIYKYFNKHYPHNVIRNSLLAILLTGGIVFTVILKIIGWKKRR